MRNMTEIVAVLSTLPKLSQHVRTLLPNVTVIDMLAGKSNQSNLDAIKVVVADCDLIMQYINSNKFTSLKWVQSTWAGVDKLIPHFQDKKKDCILTRFSDESFGFAMFEYVVAHIVNFERNQRQQYENQRNLVWAQEGKITNHRLIRDLNVGILGLGNIGKFIAEKMKLFGATIWGMSRTIPKERLDYVDEHRTTDLLVDILKNCDYIINVLPETRETSGLLNGNTLQNCREKESVFINIGRGSIIKEADLVYAIEQKWISAAILDVFENEPLPADSKLWSLSEVTISPHNAGVTQTKDVAQLFFKNYQKYTEGKCMINVVDWKRGY